MSENGVSIGVAYILFGATILSSLSIIVIPSLDIGHTEIIFDTSIHVAILVGFSFVSSGVLIAETRDE